MDTPSSPETREQLVASAAAEVADESQADILLVNADITRRTLNQVRGAVQPHRPRRPHLIVILVTAGGDADAAFEIARLFRRHYQTVTTLVSGWCKSAGTLVVLGSNAIAMSDEGELGPLDVQIQRRDELFETESGLTTEAALAELSAQAFTAFEGFFLKTKIASGYGLSTKTATSIAVQLTVGLMAPLYSQIDPLHVGTTGRAMKIAEHYGTRLLRTSGLAKSAETLQRLLNGYPSHSFVIDREEAMTLFRAVRAPTPAEQVLLDCLGGVARDTLTPNEPFIGFLIGPHDADAFDTSDHPATVHEALGEGDCGDPGAATTDTGGNDPRSPLAQSDDAPADDAGPGAPAAPDAPVTVEAP